MPSYAKFGNIKWTAGWEMNYQLGKEPGACVIRTVPHLDYLEPSGNLIIGQENAGELVIRDCRLEAPVLNEDRTWSLPILDRRWKWRYGEISGSYNKPRPDKTIIRELTPQQLAELCLIAMGERRGNWDIGRLPNFARPEINWELANPATMFDELVTSLGCVWTLDYFRDCVVVWPIGQGIDLPERPTISRQTGIAATTKPDFIKVYGKRKLYQARFFCEPIAKDTDLKIKKLADITGYDVTADDPESFPNIKDETTYNDDGQEKRVVDLARDWAYKAYRISGLFNGGWSPEELKGTSLEPQSFQDLEFIDKRAEQHIVHSEFAGETFSTRVDCEPRIYARFYDGENEGTPPLGKTVEYLYHCSFDPKSGIVKFSDPVYLYESDNEARNIKAANVQIEVAFYAGREGRFSRPVAKLDTGANNNSGARVVVKDEIEDRIIQRYSGLNIASIQHTGDHALNRLYQFAFQCLAEYESRPSETRTYHGLVPIVPDGLVRQVTWSGGGGRAPKTQASVNSEHNTYQPTPEDSRRRNAVEDMLKVPAWKRALGFSISADI